MRERLTLQALFAMGGRPDIEMLADIACLDVADVTAAMSTYGRLGAIIRCEHCWMHRQIDRMPNDLEVRTLTDTTRSVGRPFRS